MKERYLEELKVLLSQYNMSVDEVEDILADYGEMIDDAKSKNMTDEKILEIIGTPKKVVADLSENYELRDDSDLVYEYHHNRVKGRGGRSIRRNNKVVALMPFISLIAFFVLGFGYDLWHPGWLVFLATPITAIIVNACSRSHSKGIVALMPFIASVIFFVLGFVYDLWHPGWLVYLLIPVTAILTSARRMKILPLLTALSPFVAVTFFILYTYNYGEWHLAWLVFLIIPILGGLQRDKLWKVLVFEFTMLIAIAAYLYIGYTMSEWSYSLFVFLIPIGGALLTSDDNTFVINKEGLPMFLLFLACLAVYIGFGLIFGNTWHYLWMIFFIIPMFAIIKHAGRKNRIVALMPFISTILFFSLGFIFNAWSVAWIAFLLIPMVAIIKNA